MANQYNNRQMTHRAGEAKAPVSFRNNRFFTSGTDWYFSTREGIDQGPFPNRISAHDAIQKYIREKQFMS
ncbi:MAG: DUF6316 family protein [Gammaproteobacteria bacterium]|nr:DUF6316 family protein [Gammaproteobacteria bacterium]MCW8987392.1 DUF6316 family protein [Gammaproteobacteria bacterium]